MARPYTDATIPVSNDFSFVDPTPIYTEVGRTLTEWNSLYAAMIQLAGRVIGANGSTNDALGWPRSNLPALADLIVGGMKHPSGTHSLDIPDFVGEVLRFGERHYELVNGCVARYNNGRDSGYFLRPLDIIRRYVLIDNPQYRWVVAELNTLYGHFHRLKLECQAFT
jgi:hypothetical protein